MDLLLELLLVLLPLLLLYVPYHVDTTVECLGATLNKNEAAKKKHQKGTT